MAHRSMVRRSSATVVRSPLLMFFRRPTCGHRNQIPTGIFTTRVDDALTAGIRTEPQTSPVAPPCAQTPCPKNGAWANGLPAALPDPAEATAWISRRRRSAARAVQHATHGEVTWAEINQKRLLGRPLTPMLCATARPLEERGSPVDG